MLIFDFDEMVINIIVIPFVVLYHLLCEYFFRGQSLGKKLVGLRVISLNGGPPTLEDYLLRWSFRTIDVIGSLGSLGFITSATSPYGQRIGDILAQTTVIKTKVNTNISLDNLTQLADQKPASYVYQNLSKFNDQEMLLIKQAINRYDRYRTPENKDNLNKLSKIVIDKIDLDQPVKNSKQFLTEILKEYIQLTR